MQDPSTQKPQPQEENHEILKLASSYRESYGDGGGGDDVEYPVWRYRHGLPVSEDSRLQLAHILRAMDNDRHDLQPNGIVHDIIDPSLNARHLGKAELQSLVARKALVNHHQTENYVYASLYDWRSGRLCMRFAWDKDERHWALDSLCENSEMGGAVFLSQGFRDDGCQWESPDIPWVDASEWMEGLPLNSDRADDMKKLLTHLEMQAKRGVFMWVPSVVRFNVKKGAWAAQFQENIAGLPPRYFCEQLYTHLEDVFSNMLPLFNNIVINDCADSMYSRRRVGLLRKGELQVVVKAQKYLLPPHSTYTGRWHTEGFSENIVAAGVYYVDVSKDTTGGSLSFRPEETPAPHYFENRRTTEEGSSDTETDDEENDQENDEEDQDAWWDHYVKDIAAETGTAVVFSNSIPHRFRTIHNDTSEPQERLFVNFFIVDPGNPLQATTSSRGSRTLIRHALHENGLRDADLQKQVLGFVCSSTDPMHSKIVRDRARAAMSANRPRWAILNYGNAGVAKYHGDSRNPDEGRHLGHYNYNDAREDRYFEQSGCHTSDLGSGM